MDQTFKHQLWWKIPVDFYSNYEAHWTFLEIASTVENHSSSLSRWLFQSVNIYFRMLLFERSLRGRTGEKSALSTLNSVHLDCKVALSLTPWTLCFVFTRISTEYAYFLTKNMLISSQRICFFPHKGCTFGGVSIPCIYLPARWERVTVGSSGLHCVDATFVECCWLLWFVVSSSVWLQRCEQADA